MEARKSSIVKSMEVVHHEGEANVTVPWYKDKASQGRYKYN
jgi:hypothetical protein